MSIAFESARHENLIATLTGVEREMQARLDALDATVAGLRGQWSGAAREAYDRAHNEWSTAMAAFGEALDTATRGAAAAGESLVQADRDATNLWS